MKFPREGIATLAVAVLVLAACGKSEPQSNKPRANAPLQGSTAKLDEGPAKAAADDALKERLARQEAASKLFEKSRPEPAPAKAEPAPKAEPKAEPVKTAAAKLPEPAPAKAAPEPVKAEPEPPKVEVAAAKPAPAPPPAPAASALVAKLVSRVDPEFPREAVQAGAEKGNVRARMTLDGSGNVTRVEVVEANPRRIFDRAVVRALSQWHFNEGPSGRTVETEIEFRLR
ncbi:hypothetical protein BWI17_09645 [Betaproteobacteria bacterium GR16-43]|nr:hypothetical protein BWI17_09645 [Betaproteobacteria bacterium GR16-43]